MPEGKTDLPEDVYKRQVKIQEETGEQSALKLVQLMTDANLV